MPSSEECLPEYHFATPESGFNVKFMNVVQDRDDALVESVSLDDDSIPAGAFQW